MSSSALLLLAWGTGAVATTTAAMAASATPSAGLPSWLLGDGQCSATLITQRVAVTAYDCPDDVARQRHAMRQRSSGRVLTGRLLTDRPLRGAIPPGATRVLGRPLALFLLDEAAPGMPDSPAFATAPVPSYREEADLVRDRAVNPTRLGGYVPSRPDGAAGGAASPGRAEWRDRYVYRSTSAGPEIDSRPVVYRSVSALLVAEPGRFDLSGDATFPDDGPGPDVLGVRLRHRMNGRVVTGAAMPGVVDDVILTTVGEAADGLTRGWSETARQARALHDPPRWRQPFGDRARGMGLMASRGALHRLVGVVTDASGVHWRLGAFWPSVYRALLDQGLRDDARVLASRLLGPQTSNVVGQVRHFDNPHTGRIEFFRLVALRADGTPGPFPTEGRDNEQWEFLGTELPSGREVLSPLRVWRAEEMNPPIGKRFVRFNGITRQVEYFRLKAHDRDGRAPALPSPGASDEHWTYEGTDLRVWRNPFAQWTPVTPLVPLSPLPGTGPALPAPEAARR